MTSPPTFSPSSFLSLAERTEYEVWLLEAIYAIVKQEMLSVWPDAIVYPVDKKKAQFFHYKQGGGVIGDWRPGFLKVGAPLIFVSTFKLLDMFIEWVLEENGVRSTFRFSEKLKLLKKSPLFPPLIESRPWLKERLIALYSTLEPLRGTIVHDRHFSTVDGAIEVSESKRKDIGPIVEISKAHLRKLALTIVSVLKYVNGSWHLDAFREKMLRYDLDELRILHKLPLLGQQRPYHTRVRVYTTNSDPLQVDPIAILSDLTSRYADRDCSFDLRVLIVKDGTVADAYLFPWNLFETLDSNWRRGIHPEQHRTEIPDDIDSAHLRDETR